MQTVEWAQVLHTAADSLVPDSGLRSIVVLRDSLPQDSGLVPKVMLRDSLAADSLRRDSMAAEDAIFSEDAMNDPIFSKGEDSTQFIFEGGNRVLLYGNGKVTFQDMELTADFIDFNMDTKLAYAKAT
ncbi:hypothetical protein AGMMS4956_09690 [Bacteroidia bacterium]|nr:hypothetical protein AGMMS4956_09690 [Bacteroidia bacterium]